MQSPKALYRAILRAHRHLPTEFRTLGDSYLKHEFRAHTKVSDSFQLNKFFTEWNKYLTAVSQQNLHSSSLSSEIAAKDLEIHQLEALPDDKAEQILYLKSSIDSIYSKESKPHI
ncbi:hypothetical protein BB561_003435 [Smittium simulii]|uniref:Succinate dehydrogenase assembly factor 3 n=1 Tax=Smittium simulii TaxID=133385 RepID=A0A2T9YLB2_9FUNG|nr:hypothetical protein BB561_003435 [Smittium simulii]